MKKFELLRINDFLMKSVNYKSHEFAYAIYKNKQKVDEILIEVDFMNDIDPEYVEYENKRIELCKTTSKKDPTGREIVKDGRFEIGDVEIFKNGMDELRKQYESFIQKRDEQINRFNIIMQQEVEIDFVKVDKKDLPVEITTATEMFEYGFMIS
jgi:hypothetical protein